MAEPTRPPEEPVDASRLRVAIVAAEFNREVTDRLLAGAREWLTTCKVPGDAVEVFWVPGSFEIPLACRAAAESGRFDAVVALGCVIRGETPHFDYVASEAARGATWVMMETGIPVSFGVLTTEDDGQALERAGGSRGNKGRDAAASAVRMALLLPEIRGRH